MPRKNNPGAAYSVTGRARAKSVCEYALLSLLILIGAGCRSGPAPAPVIGEAFVGPATLNLREEISLRSKTVATVKHGERLEILQRRRRFLLVRTTRKNEGWTDSRQLLSTTQMTALRKLAERAATLTSHGKASVFDPLNVHTEAHRLSPSFHQLKEGDLVDVVGHRLTPRTGTKPPGEELFKAPVVAKRPRKPAVKKEKSSGKLPPPPLPAPPSPPPNWLELSRTRVAPTPAPASAAASKSDAKPAPAVAMEDWSLARMKDGRAGWVLTRNLRMAIPDEVAQYAEGHRITSYFSLGDVHDGTDVKHNWLWTTIAKGGERYEFDSFRVFVWSIRRHRYETAYIERNVVGYFPVEIRTVTLGSRKGSFESPGFRIIVENKEGQPEKRTYAFQGYRVALISKVPYKPEPEEAAVSTAADQFAERVPEEKPFSARVRDSLTNLWHRIRGK